MSSAIGVARYVKSAMDSSWDFIHRGLRNRFKGAPDSKTGCKRKFRLKRQLLAFRKKRLTINIYILLFIAFLLICLIAFVFHLDIFYLLTQYAISILMFAL